ALKNPNSKYRNYYFFRKGSKDTPPNNWSSFFGGSAWRYFEETGEWVLHLFSDKQMDLNWECKELREDMIGMLRWWLEQGIDGFRFDAINYISKQREFPDGNLTIAEVIGYCGIEHYFYGPRLHDYLREIREKALDPYQAFSIGEMPGIGTQMQKLLTGEDRGELDMMFSFDHLETPGHKRYHTYQYDLEFYKEYLADTISQLGNQCHMALYYNNHDNPRFLSKVGAPAQYRSELAKMLAVIQFTSRGTPFIFQGDEFGAANHHFDSIDQIKDIESHNFYRYWTKQVGMTKEKAFSMVQFGTRDQGRTPMQWTSEQNGGFTTGTPWIESDGDYTVWNVEDQLHDEHSVLSFYKMLIQLRKKEKAFAYGETVFIKKHVKRLFLYERMYQGKKFFIECNLSDGIKERFYRVDSYTLLLSSYETTAAKLRPFEANIYMESLDAKSV
ncbi:MAG: alpha-glucosidase, partial [Clostridia bacterium]|nr:alpha-glucosidase [Clostridia bacterium]